MDNKLIEEMKSFCSRFKMPNMDSDMCKLGLGEIVEFQSEGLRGRTTEEIEDFIFKTHSYATILKNKQSSLKAFITGLNSVINRFVADNIDTVDKFLPYTAKREAIISSSQDVSKYEVSLVSARMQLEKIGDLPGGVDATLRSLESYLRRRHLNG